MHRNSNLAAVVAPLLLAACSSQPAQRASDADADLRPDTSLPEAAATITADDMREHIAFLASDEMRGRDTPSPQLDAAADYLARTFAELGLEPAGGDGTFIQRYRLPRVKLDAERTGLELRGADGARDLVYGRDFFALPGSPAARNAAIVHAGASIDDVPADALRGRVPVVTLDGPVSRAWRTTVGPARAAARDAGARAVVFVLEPGATEGTIAALARLAAEPRRVVGEVDDVPAFFVRSEKVRDTFRDAGLDPDAPPTGAPVRGVALSGSAPARVLDSPAAPNVVAVVPGADPELRETYVVFSAHMDHIGVGRPDASGDSIYNGADDNASGTSTLLEVAEAFASLPRPPARSVVFLAVSGEEKGLLGSRWFTEHPTIPLERAVANMNVDMIARNSPDSIVVIGQEYSSLGPLVQSVAERNPGLGLTVAEDIWPEQRFFFRSDHFNFARKEVPALFFFAGTHEDYHKPSDEVATLDFDKAARVARLVFHTAHAIASAPEPPRWTDEGLAEVRRMTR